VTDITVTELRFGYLLHPLDCPHPETTRSTRTDYGTFGWRYQMCATCASERLLAAEDDEEDGDWSPILSTEDVPPAFLAAVGLDDADENLVYTFLRARHDSWKRGFRR
jgi:hypothetical protein